MRIYKEVTIKTYGAWAGAKIFVDKLTQEEADILEVCLMDCFPDGLSETYLNDTLWFDSEWLLKEALSMSQEQVDEFWER